MTPLEKLKGSVFVGLFGKQAGLKLLHWLDPCCNTFCTDVLACTVQPEGFATGVFPLAAVQDLTSPGVVDPLAYQTKLTTVGTGDALTLADGTVIGQLKRVDYVAEGAPSDTAILTLTGYTTITFDAVNSYVTLLWDGGAWLVVETSAVGIIIV